MTDTHTHQFFFKTREEIDLITCSGGKTDNHHIQQKIKIFFFLITRKGIDLISYWGGEDTWGGRQLTQTENFVKKSSEWRLLNKLKCQGTKMYLWLTI